MNITSSFFDSAPFMPHGHCYLWSKWLVTLHVLSDTLIVIAYYSIPITLLYFIRKRKDIEFHWMFVCFALFILACGTTHLMEIWNVWHADYWLSGGIKALTAAASVPTAILLAKLVPQALTLPSARALQQARDELELRVAERTHQLKLANDTLTREADERHRAEQASRESEARLRAVLDSTPNAVVVINSKGLIIDWNAQAERIFGWSRTEALERDLTETIIPRQYREAHRRGMAHLLATGEGPALQRAMEMSAARRDGSEFPVELFITPVKTQTSTNYCGFITDLTARKQAQKELRESQNLLQAVIENSPTVIYVKDLEGRYLLANRRFVELFHASRDNIVGKTDYDFFTRSQAEAFRAMDARVINANQPLTEEEVAPHSDGLHTYMSVKCPLRDETGKAYAIFGLSTDITERKRAEEQLQASLKEVNDLKAALDEHAIVAITDHQGKITYVNDKFCAISKYSRDELLGQDHRLINSGHHAKEFIRGLWTTIAQGKVWKGEIKNRAKDGCFYWVATTIVPFLTEEGKPHHYVAIRADITEKKIAEERLQASLKEVNDLKAALDEHAIVAITDPKGKITYVNDKFCAISKYPREELLGQDHRLINSGYHAKEFIQSLWTTISQGKVWKGEIKNRAKDGSFYWVATTIVPFLTEEGKPRHYVAIRADITEKKIAEEQIHSLNAELEQRVVERTAELESFSYSISHDLRAPLRAMGGYARMLQEDVGRQLPPAAAQKLDRIYENANKMGQLIDGLLAFSRLSQQPLKKQRIHTTELARRVWDELHLERGTRPIQITIAPLPECQADATLLHQVFVNLISNAIKYSRQREPAVVEVGWDQRQQAYFVKDNGAGFDMQYAGKLFGVFQRLHRADEFEGTGVGLAIVQRIVCRHGGKIWAQAKPDRGATFSFTLTEEHAHGE